eukprot:TRINITY_DN21955_c1_g1_i1.p1 TRINITY_DN21955_c1_g1~~TRINITY_DN21955_c1_g1_i1.p1  ORF type:complete len:260 (+),score=55.66 TRINITY_DN21955_c1_g1_i1:49-780(+)
MPLVVLCGHPLSGKSTVAAQLKEYFESKGKLVHLVDDSCLDSSKYDAYATERARKITRETVKALVNKHMARDSIVLVDSLNSMKGVRYELYCLGRSISTQHCVVYVQCPAEVCRERFHAMETKPYAEEVFEDLLLQLEEPNARRRWDKPLFKAQTAHVEADWGTTDLSVEFSCEGIYKHLVESIAPVPHAATVPQRLSETNFVQQLNDTTRAIVKAVQVALQDGATVGNDVFIEGSSKKVSTG